MLCQFERLLYPSASAVGIGSYMVAVYKPCESVVDSTGAILRRVKAVGYGLPISAQIKFDLQGRWQKDPKHGMQFEMESYREVVSLTEEGIIAYLSSGQIKGVGPALARKIYDEFGEDTLKVLDNSPEKLLIIKGISEAKLERICASYLANRAARDVVAFLAPYGITANRAVKLFQIYKHRTLATVKDHPYTLCEIDGIGFLTADRIARSMGMDALSTERADAGLLYALEDAESRGNLCMEKHTYIRAAQELLATPALTEEMLANRAATLVAARKLVAYDGYVYLARAAEAESTVARLAAQAAVRKRKDERAEIDAALAQREKETGITLATEQRKAVRAALSETFTVITGGPGTGKTMIQKFILEIFAKLHPERSACCCAPTGRAASRLSQSTGRAAYTVHRMLGLPAVGSVKAIPKLTYDMIIVDEASMLDVYIAAKLMEAVPEGAQLVFVGDADQLPSVGPGAVLSELIASERVPVIRLDRVYRQKAGSRIALNAQLIRHGNLNIEYGKDFRFIDSPELSQSAQTIEEMYVQKVREYGIDRVAMLTPFRQKTETSVNALNEVLRDRVNPPSPSKAECAIGRKVFREGDKVMLCKNRGDVNNGDIGRVVRIQTGFHETVLQVDFGDDKVIEFDKECFDMFDWGYASSVHKSQGSEYDCVIINLQCAHNIMLTRPLIYTAVTRGKQEAIIVGERRALCVAIKRPEAKRRGTRLAKRIQELIKRRSSWLF